MTEYRKQMSEDEGQTAYGLLSSDLCFLLSEYGNNSHLGNWLPIGI
jgi:hypothetical protein